MKTNYTDDLKGLLTTMFSPSSPEDDTAHAMTLVDMHAQVTNILPSKWVDQADVYNMLKELEYKIFQEKHEWEHENGAGKKETRVSYSLKYYVKINS